MEPARLRAVKPRGSFVDVRRPDPSRWDFTRLAAHGDDNLALAEAGLDAWAAALDGEDPR
jgi:hypothetical protein